MRVSDRKKSGVAPTTFFPITFCSRLVQKYPHLAFFERITNTPSTHLRVVGRGCSRYPCKKYQDVNNGQGKNLNCNKYGSGYFRPQSSNIVPQQFRTSQVLGCLLLVFRLSWHLGIMSSGWSSEIFGRFT